MRLTKENYELLMFDLLEGNLSEQQSLDLMAQIESDEFFFKEWKLFKSTILVAEESIQFEGKAALLKEEDDERGGFIIPMRRLYSVATAACIILLIGFGIQRYGSDEQIADEPSSEILSNPEKQSPKVVNEDNESAIIEEQFVKQEPVLNQNKKATNTSVKDQHPAPKSEKLKVTPILEDDEIIVKEDLEKIEVEENLGSKELNRIVQDNIDIPTFEENENQGEKNVDASVTYSFTERIRGTIANTIAMVSNPKIRFIPEWKQRRINIELETNGYLAVATVDPFNKKK
ncbi:hypothetical protein GYB22_12245 [bacterium]|nr:hypothetical protein [bacterium]